MLEQSIEIERADMEDALEMEREPEREKERERWQEREDKIGGDT
jgi:hypothetical protein